MNVRSSATFMAADIGKARIFHEDGRVDTYDDQTLAFAVWIALPRGKRAAFRE
jgi:hypothetical protein